MKAGTGHPGLPAYEGEDMEHYLRRLAKHLGREIAGPPLKPLTIPLDRATRGA